MAAVNLFFGIFVKRNVGICFACHEEKLKDHSFWNHRPIIDIKQRHFSWFIWVAKKNLLRAIILIGLIVYYTLHITAQYNPQYNLNNQGFHCLCIFDQQKKTIESYSSPISTGICHNKKHEGHGVLVC